jgi:hypothetical protein
VRFYVRVDVFAGVWRFRADVGQFLSKEQGKKPVSFRFFFFSFFFGFSLSLSFVFLPRRQQEKQENTVKRRREEEAYYISVSHDVSNEKGRR